MQIRVCCIRVGDSNQNRLSIRKWRRVARWRCAIVAFSRLATLRRYRIAERLMARMRTSSMDRSQREHYPGGRIDPTSGRGLSTANPDLSSRSGVTPRHPGARSNRGMGHCSARTSRRFPVTAGDANAAFNALVERTPNSARFSSVERPQTISASQLAGHSASPWTAPANRDQLPYSRSTFATRTLNAAYQRSRPSRCASRCSACRRQRRIDSRSCQ
jgi:hypothetical protein